MPVRFLGSLWPLSVAGVWTVKLSVIREYTATAFRPIHAFCLCLLGFMDTLFCSEMFDWSFDLLGLMTAALFRNV